MFTYPTHIQQVCHCSFRTVPRISYILGKYVTWSSLVKLFIVATLTLDKVNPQPTPLQNPTDISSCIDMLWNIVYSLYQIRDSGYTVVFNM